MVDILIDVIRSDVSILMVLVQPRQQQRKYWCWYLVGSWAGHGELFWAGTGNSLVIRQQILFSTNHASRVNIQIYSLPCQHFETFVIFSVWKKSCYLASRDKYFDILAAETLTSVFNILTDHTISAHPLQPPLHQWSHCHQFSSQESPSAQQFPLDLQPQTRDWVWIERSGQQ